MPIGVGRSSIILVTLFSKDVFHVILHLVISHLLLPQNMSQVHILHVLLQKTFYFTKKTYYNLNNVQ